MTEIPNSHFTTLQGAYDVETMEATLRVRRYDPETQRSRFDQFTVTIPVTASVLDALDAIKDQHDGSLSDRKSTRLNSSHT